MDRSASQPAFGLLAEFETPADLLAAAREVRDAGYTRWDTHSPFPIHGMDQAMGIRPTVLPWVVFGAGFGGCLLSMGFQWWTNAVDYPYLISGKPYWSIPASIPVAFEVTVLFSALTAVFGMLLLNGLPRLHHPLFGSRRFARVTTDRMFLVIESADPRFQEAETSAFLESLDPATIERLEDMP